MRLIVLLLLASALPACAQQAAPPSWKEIGFLLGKWSAAGGGKEKGPADGQGAFSFEAELNRNIIVRRSFAEYPSAPRHDDLMIIYLDPPGAPPRAMYFDSEGHVIRYNLAIPSPGHAVFESDGTQPGPRYRLSYALDREILEGVFEVAAPGSPFREYLRWRSRRN